MNDIPTKQPPNSELPSHLTLNKSAVGEFLSIKVYVFLTLLDGSFLRQVKRYRLELKNKTVLGTKLIILMPIHLEIVELSMGTGLRLLWTVTLLCRLSANCKTISK